MFIDSLHPQFPSGPPQRAGQRLCFNKILSNSGFPNPRALQHRVSNSLPVAAQVPQALYRCPLSFGRGGKIEGICLPGTFWKSPFHRSSCSNLASRFSDMSSFVQKFMPCFLEGASPLPCFGLGVIVKRLNCRKVTTFTLRLCGTHDQNSIPHFLGCTLHISHISPSSQKLKGKYVQY